MITAVYPLGQQSCVWVDHTSRQMLSHWHFSPLLMYAFYTPTSLALSLCLLASLYHCLPLSLPLFVSVCLTTLSLSLSRSFKLFLSFHHSMNYGYDGCLWLPEASESSTLNPKCCLELCAIKPTPTRYRNSRTWSLREVVSLVRVSCGRRVQNICTGLLIKTGFLQMICWFLFLNLFRYFKGPMSQKCKPQYLKLQVWTLYNIMKLLPKFTRLDCYCNIVTDRMEYITHQSQVSTCRKHFPITQTLLQIFLHTGRNRKDSYIVQLDARHAALQVGCASVIDACVSMARIEKMGRGGRVGKMRGDEHDLEVT